MRNIGIISTLKLDMSQEIIIPIKLDLLMDNQNIIFDEKFNIVEVILV